MPLGVRIASRLLLVSAVSIAARAAARWLSRAATYAAFCAGSLRSTAWLAVSSAWPNLSASVSWAVLKAMMSASDFIGALAGRRPRYAFRSRLNSAVRTSNGAAEVGVAICTVVAPSACTAAIAATYCALVLLITPIRLPASASGFRPLR